MKQVLKKLVAMILAVLSLLIFLIVLFVLFKVWGLHTSLKEGVAALSGGTQQAIERFEESTDRMQTSVNQALNTLGQMEDAIRERKGRLEPENPLSNPVLHTLHERFSQNIEAGFQVALAVSEAAATINTSLETLNRFSILKVPTFTDELTRLAERFQGMKNLMHEFRYDLEGLESGVSVIKIEAILIKTQSFRVPLNQVQKALDGLVNILVAKRKDIIELEGNLLFYINLGALAFSLLCPLLMAGQVCLLLRSWKWLRC